MLQNAFATLTRDGMRATLCPIEGGFVLLSETGHRWKALSGSTRQTLAALARDGWYPVEVDSAAFHDEFAAEEGAPFVTALSRLAVIMDHHRVVAPPRYNDASLSFVVEDGAAPFVPGETLTVNVGDVRPKPITWPLFLATVGAVAIAGLVGFGAGRIATPPSVVNASADQLDAAFADGVYMGRLCAAHPDELACAPEALKRAGR